MDNVRKAMPAPVKKDIVFVAASHGWDVVRKVQEQGYSVVRGTENLQPHAMCTHIYKNDQIVEI
jgi:hypothetical protein